MTTLEDIKVIEQEHTDIDYETDEGIKIIKEKITEEEDILDNNQTLRCIYIKKNGKQCRQSGKPTQKGGPIIDGYCSFHINHKEK